MRRPEDSPVPPSRLSPGAVINDRYEIVGTLGSGGFAVVYRGQDREIDRPVAIKVLNPQVFGDDPDKIDELFARFRREARSAARIQHSGVVTIFDIGKIEPYGQPYIVMELLEGHDLEDEMNRKGPMPAERALPLFIDVLEALGEGHELGIVHKDLKPSNLFLIRPGVRGEALRIVDFGIARFGEGGRLTSTGQVLGTPQYLAPEYITEQIVSSALDVYQMGIILIEMLLGAPLLEEEVPWKCAMIHCSGSLPIPPRLVESPLGPILAQALHVDPNARYANANLFAEALEAACDKAARALRRADPIKRAAPPTVVWTPGENPLGTVEVNLRTPTVKADGPPKGPTRVVAERESLDDMIDDDWLRGHKSPAQRYGPIAFIALVLMLVGWIAYSATGAPDNPDALPPAAATGDEPDKADAVADKHAANPVPAPKASKLPPTDKPPKPLAHTAQPLQVKLTVGPTGATIKANGREIKNRPALLDFKSARDKPIKITVSHPDYVSKHKTVEPTSPDLGIFLTQTRSKTPATKRDRPAVHPSKKSDDAPRDKGVDLPVIQ